MTATQTGTALVRNAYDTFTQGDVTAMTALWQPDIVWTECAGDPYGGVYRGAHEVLEKMFAPIPDDWKSFSATPDEYLDCGDVVIALGWYQGVSARSGKALRARFAHVFRLMDGRIASFEAVTDSQRLTEALAG